MNTYSIPPSYDFVTSNIPNGVATQNAVYVNFHFGWSIFNIVCSNIYKISWLNSTNDVLNKKKLCESNLI